LIDNLLKTKICDIIILVEWVKNMLFLFKIKINPKKFLYLMGLVVVANLLFFPRQALLVQNSEERSDQQISNQDEQLTNDIKQQIDEKGKKIEELQQQIDQYNQNIATKQKEQASIENEISMFDDRIAKKNLNIEAQENLIEKLTLEITDLETKISDKEDEILSEKDDLSDMIRKMYEYDQKTYLEVTIGNNNFSEYFTQLKYIEQLEKSTKDALDHLKTLKSTLEGQKENLDGKKKEVEAEKTKLEGERSELEGEKTYKDQLLFDTKLDEAKFQQLIEQVRQEEVLTNTEISNLTQEMQQRLSNEDFVGLGGDIIQGNATLTWPINPKYGISCGFHCADYPFKKWFEHSGMDTRTPQGTPIGAAASGYVVIAKDGGMGYSYILIEHGDGLASIYGHVSRIDVAPEQYVRTGEIIGLSGGMPGFPGTGKFSTGPHLHFEVRVNGIPDDPLKYLPAIL